MPPKTVKKYQNIYLYNTGVRDGEFITSAYDAKQNVGTIAQIFGFYPPSQDGVEALKATDLRDKFARIDFFAPLTPEKRLAWLMKHMTDDNDLYLNEVPDLKIKFHAISGPDMLLKFTEEQRAYLLELEEPILITKVYQMSAGVEKKRVGRKNLIFRPGNWELLLDTSEDVDFTGYTLDIEKSTIGRYNGVINTGMYVIVDDVNLAIRVPKTKPYTPAELASHIDPEVEELINWFSPSVYKSLIQKIIRTRSPTTNYLDEVHASEVVLVTSFCMLLKHPGTMDYALNRHTSGFESATKRLAVTIAEDSSIANPFTLLSMFAAAYIAKKRKHWRPSYVLVKLWIDAALESLQCTNMYEYKTSQIEVDLAPTPTNFCYQLLNATGSFHSDIYMLGYMAENDGALSTKYTKTGVVEVPILHCIDHHNIRDIAWHFTYSTLKSLVEDGDTSYAGLFKKLWNESSSINPRKRNYPDGDYVSGLTEFTQEVRLAQYEIWLVHYQVLSDRELLEGPKYVESFGLHDSWLSALIGPIEVSIVVERDGESKKITTVCIVDPHSTGNFIVVPKPGREKVKVGKEDVKQLILTEDEKQDAIDQTKGRLKEGIRARVPASIQHVVKKAVITLKKNVYYVNDVTWEEFRLFKIKLPYQAEMDRTRLNACLWTGEGIEEEANAKALSELKLLDAASRNRLLMYITPITSEIVLHSIDLHGGGTYYQVDITDSAVYEYLTKLCIIFPAFLEVSTKGFRIKYGPGAWRVFREIKEIVSGKMLETETTSGTFKWRVPQPDDRKLYSHQVEALEKMKVAGNCHLIYITPGLGKTLIAMNYIKYLIETEQMPKYCVYTLPNSTITSVMEEFESYNFRVNLLDLRQTKDANVKIRPGYINFVKHDDLRKRNFKADLEEIASDLFFLVDEFHYTLARGTQRTSVTLSIARLAKYLVGMTGTLITDENAGPIVQWLSLVAKFEVTMDNYWCAMGLLIASRIQTKVVVTNREVDIQLSPELKAQHDKYLQTQHFLDAVRLCYEIVQDEMVKEAMKYIRRKIGVFIIAKDKTMQEYIAEQITAKRPQSNIFRITSENSINYTSKNKQWYDAIITTPRHSTGYNLTKLFTTVKSIYFGNEATRTQLEARTNRLGQKNEVEIVTLHTGVLTYIMERYNKIKSLADFVSGFAKVVNI